MFHVSVKKRQPGIKRRIKSRKSIPFNKKLMKPDPDFVDERIQKKDEPKGFWQRFANIFE